MGKIGIRTVLYAKLSARFCLLKKSLPPSFLNQTSRSQLFLFIFNSVLRPFQDYFSSYATGQSVGGRKRENPEKNHLAHPQAECSLSQLFLSNKHLTAHFDAILREAVSRKTFSKFYRIHYELIFKFNVGLKTFLRTRAFRNQNFMVTWFTNLRDL